MKHLFISFCVLLFSCTAADQKQLPSPADDQLVEIIEDIYTSDNQLDGSEFVTIDSIRIKEKIVDDNTKTCLVKFFVNGSYQSAAMAPGYDQKRPDLNADTTLTIIYQENKWAVSHPGH